MQFKHSLATFINDADLRGAGFLYWVFFVFGDLFTTAAGLYFGYTEGSPFAKYFGTNPGIILGWLAAGFVV